MAPGSFRQSPIIVPPGDAVEPAREDCAPDWTILEGIKLQYHMHQAWVIRRERGVAAGGQAPQ
jgi:hypothetical protein